MKTNNKLLVTEDGTAYAILSSREAQLLLGICVITTIDKETEEESEYSLCSKQDIEEAAERGATIVTYLGEIMPISSHFLYPFSEMVSQGIEKVTNLLDISRQDAVNILYNWTIDFQNESERKPIEEGTLYERIDEFIERKMFVHQFKNFQWDDDAVINLQYIMAQTPNADFNMGDFDKLRRLAMEFTLYERNNNIKWNEDGNTDWETGISAFLEKKKAQRAS